MNPLDPELVSAFTWPPPLADLRRIDPVLDGEFHPGVDAALRLIAPDVQIRVVGAATAGG